MCGLSVFIMSCVTRRLHSNIVHISYGFYVCIKRLEVYSFSIASETTLYLKKTSHLILSISLPIINRFLRAKTECFARLCHRLSVCLSVTLVICIKTVQARITKSSLWAAPRSLVYRDKISCHWVQGFPSSEGVKEGYPLKNVILPLLARIM